MIWIAFVLMMSAVYLTRAFGFWVAPDINPPLKGAKFFQYIPSSILVSMVAPHALNHGHEELVAFMIVAVVQTLKRNPLLSMLSGIVVVSIMRNFQL